VSFIVNNSLVHGDLSLLFAGWVCVSEPWCIWWSFKGCSTNSPSMTLFMLCQSIMMACIRSF